MLSHAEDQAVPFRYRVIDEDGSDLGPLASQRGEWSSGDRLSRWHGEKLEVVSFVDAEEHEPFDGYIIVRTA